MPLNSDSEEEEDVYVVLEFAENIPKLSADTSIKVIGLDSDTPVLQYQKQTFRGEWMDCLGTKVLFKEKTRPEPVDPVFSPAVKEQHEYVMTTRKILKLEHYVLNPKTLSEPNNESNDALCEHDNAAEDTLCDVNVSVGGNDDVEMS